MDDKLTQLILDEIKENRREVRRLREDVTSLKVKFGMIAVGFGFIGGFIKPFVLAILGGKH
jgi:hypothetical protein